MNPSIVKWNEQVVASYRLVIPYTKRVNLTSDIVCVVRWNTLDQFTGYLEFSPDSDPEIFPVEYRQKCIDPISDYGTSSSPRIYVIGEDARLITLGTRLYAFFNYIDSSSENPSRSICYVHIQFDVRGAYSSEAHIRLDVSQLSSSAQKNWSPFVYDDRIYLSMNFLPHVVVDSGIRLTAQTEDSLSPDGLLARFQSNNNLLEHEYSDQENECSKHENNKMSITSRRAECLSVSTSSFHAATGASAALANINISNCRITETLESRSLPNKANAAKVHLVPWLWGELQGGTPAIRYNETAYLGLFHSKFYHEIEGYMWYVFGAYLFDATPPFHILALSESPLILKRDWYEKFEYAFDNVQYIVYPMGIIREIGEGDFALGDSDFLYISFGIQVCNTCTNIFILVLVNSLIPFFLAIQTVSPFRMMVGKLLRSAHEI